MHRPASKARAATRKARCGSDAGLAHSGAHHTLRAQLRRCGKNSNRINSLRILSDSYAQIFQHNQWISCGGKAGDLDV